MAYGYSPPRGRSTTTLIVLGLLFLIVGGLGTVGALWGFGIIPNPFGKTTLAGPSREGMVAVPVSAIDIPSMSKVTRDHLFDKEAKEIKLIYIKPEELRPDMIRDLSQIIGRVMKREKKPGFAFTERDFYPVGTQPGLTAAIPPGKRSFVLPVEKITGIATLQPGDHFDIVGSLAVDDKKNPTGSTPKDLINSAMVVSPTGQPYPPKRSVVRSLVANGLVLTPPTIRLVPTGASTSLAGGAPPKTKPVQEIAIAIDADEVAILADALKVDASLTCVARSGQPNGNTDPEMPIVVPTPNVPTVKIKTIETIVNGKREVLRFGEAGEPLVDAGKELIELAPRGTEKP